MLCQECGNPLNEGDKSCKICGASVTSIDDTKTPAIEVDFDWNLKGFPEPKKTEDIDFNWGTENMQKNGVGAPFKDSLDELNKFLTFDKAKMDFQKLLDDQYEKMGQSTYPDMENPPRGQMNLSGIINGTRAEMDHGPGDEPPKVGIEDEEEPEVIWISHDAQLKTTDKRDGEADPYGHGVDNKEAVQLEANMESSRQEADSEDLIEADMQEKAGDPETDSFKQEGEGIELARQDVESPLWFEEEKEPEKKKEGIVVKAILTFVILLLLAEATILGAQFFLSNSKFAYKAAEINSTVSSVLVDLKTRVTNLFGGDDRETVKETDTEGTTDPDGDLQEGQESEETTPNDPDPKPTADKGILISDLIYLNKNIDKVEANNSLAWEKGRKYPLSSIDDSIPLENNHWYTDEKGQHVYYDREILASLIRFDSQWQDYVNGGSKQVVDLTKQGSKARKNVETFSKIGKVEQSFLSLEVGEIRQYEEMFYVWTYEEIKEIQGGKTTIKKYNWIYCLEPVGKEMKIVNYYKY